MDEIYDEFDTGNYNSICVAYMMQALRNIEVDENTVWKAVSEMRWLFDTVSASEISK